MKGCDTGTDICTAPEIKLGNAAPPAFANTTNRQQLQVGLVVERLLANSRGRLYLQHLIEVDIAHRVLPAPAMARVAVPLNGPSETLLDVYLWRPACVTAQLGVVTL
jgi:hypothetical protein